MESFSQLEARGFSCLLAAGNHFSLIVNVRLLQCRPTERSTGGGRRQRPQYGTKNCRTVAAPPATGSCLFAFLRVVSLWQLRCGGGAAVSRGLWADSLPTALLLPLGEAKTVSLTQVHFEAQQRIVHERQLRGLTRKGFVRSYHEYTPILLLFMNMCTDTHVTHSYKPKSVLLFMNMCTYTHVTHSYTFNIIEWLQI